MSIHAHAENTMPKWQQICIGIFFSHYLHIFNDKIRLICSKLDTATSMLITSPEGCLLRIKLSNQSLYEENHIMPQTKAANQNCEVCLTLQNVYYTTIKWDSKLDT